LRNLRLALHIARPSLRIGIGATLSIAFIAVAFLALAANVISERTFDAVAPIALPVARVFTRPAEAESAASSFDASRERLRGALDRFDRATQKRVSSQEATADVELRKAATALRTQRDQLLAQLIDRSDPNDMRDFKSALGTRMENSAELIRVSDQARDLAYAYVVRYEEMRKRVRDSIDRAWKVFGRVVAQQSLIALGRQIEELGTQTVGMSETTDLRVAAEVEEAIGKTLAENERSLAASQGKTWFASMREDLAYLVSSRTSLQYAYERQRSVAEGLSRARSRLQLPSIRSLAPSVDVLPTVAPIAVPIPTTPPKANERKQTVIAWISSGVLLLLITISVVTVRSVVGPVRRMVSATGRIAQGDTMVRVRTGGIKELNTLAVAFNSMAERLAFAERAKRDYRQQLEAKVEERTKQLKHLASNDPLTSLPNHRQLFVMLNQELGRAQATNSMVGVFFLDIDNFKNINDGRGHGFGDKVLKAMAERLKAIAQEFGFAARLGGDEFVVIMNRAVTLEKVREAGERLVHAFHAPLTVDGRDLALSISVGASAFPEHGSNAETLLQTADAALFRAKELGRSQLNMYSPDLLEAASAKFAVEQGLRGALDKDELELMFQPEFSVETRDVQLVEALIRWRQPDGRFASPGEFLGVAEESGLIREMSDWVLRNAIMTAARWHYGSWPQARVAINVSSRQLIDANFVEHVKSLLDEYRLPPRCIEIELTETVLQTGRVTLESLRQLRAHGIAIALDDFGTGYSSLASLQQLPLTRIKLDRSLIDEVDTNTRALAIARSIIGLARNLGLEITAEGIERPEQVRLLASEGPMVMQGFLFSRPLAASNVIVALPMVVQRGRQLMTANPSTRSHHATNDRLATPVSQKDPKAATPPSFR